MTPSEPSPGLGGKESRRGDDGLSLEIKENMEGWICLHRRLLESPIFSSEKGLKIWMWCLLKASHKKKDMYLGQQKICLQPGEFVFGRDSASNELQMSASTIRNWMVQLKKDSYVDIKTTNKYSVVTILNWNEYQEKDSRKDSRKTAEKQQNNTNNNVNNGNKLSLTKNVKDNTKRDFDIDLILQAFEKRLGYKPTDKKPRFTAHTFKKQLERFIEQIAPYKPGLTLEGTVNLVFDWYLDRNEGVRVESLDTIRRAVVNVLFVETRKKYGIEG